MYLDAGLPGKVSVGNALTHWEAELVGFFASFVYLRLLLFHVFSISCRTAGKNHGRTSTCVLGASNLNRMLCRASAERVAGPLYDADQSFQHAHDCYSGVEADICFWRKWEDVEAIC